MSLDSQSKFQIFTLFSACHVGLQTGLCKFAQNINSMNIWSLGTHRDPKFKKCLFYQSPITLQFLNFIHWIVLDLVFHCMTVKTIYSIKRNLGRRLLKYNKGKNVDKLLYFSNENSWRCLLSILFWKNNALMVTFWLAFFKSKMISCSKCY